jgi:tetratricopeptide (TPR) repeat protein
MDAVSHPHPAVQDLVARWMVPVRLTFGVPAHRATLQNLGALWTPTHWVLDARGREFRREIGFLDGADLHAVLSEGVALALVANGRAGEAEDVLDEAIAREGSDGRRAGSLHYWRGAVAYLRTGEHDAMAPWWDEARELDPEGWGRRAVT